ncbi:DNA polymerase IV [Acidisarcina polymorpha]|uniref:DNA polymerase IV n=1 Tax=Acidisarcina polymorpha TaxID=2211140 RepID=A0A2Z5G865_9BACT|nr:DNA polymerase Y family protein [Acidisarcina polymorpha]AXC15159.1 DNA polymerase IV [Acidisarcina polymorpha]
MSSEVYVCVYAKEFPAQALLRLRPEMRSKAIAVMDGDPPFQRVCSLNKYARELGVVTGMSRSELEGFPSINILKRSPREEQTTCFGLLECAWTYSPRIEEIHSDAAFCCVLDMSGSEKLFGPPQIAASRIQEAFAALGLSCSAAVSSNFHAAVCLARGSRSCQTPVIAPTGAERQSLARLPLAVLDVSEEDTETFMQWGITTLGELAVLPEKDLIARLGQEGKQLRQLARGEYPHLFLPVEPIIELKEYLELDSPVDVLDSLLFGAGVMLEQLIERAKARVLCLAAVIAELGVEGGGIHTRIIRPAIPSNDKKLWLKLLHLDWISYPPQAAIISMSLTAETGQAGTLQLGLFSPQLPEPERLDVTLARIRAVVGEERVGSIELKDSHHPDEFHVKPFTLTGKPDRHDREVKMPATVMRCIRPPETVTMVSRNHVPHIFYFRGIAYEAENVYGPWRAAGGWWSDGHWSIEEWDIIARLRDSISTYPPKDNLLCCCMTREINTDIWQVSALYD